MAESESRHYLAFTITAAWAAVKHYGFFAVKRLILFHYHRADAPAQASSTPVQPGHLSGWFAGRGNLFHTFQAPGTG